MKTIFEQTKWIDQKDVIPKAVHINNSIKEAISLALEKVDKIIDEIEYWDFIEENEYGNTFRKEGIEELKSQIKKLEEKE